MNKIIPWRNFRDTAFLHEITAVSDCSKNYELTVLSSVIFSNFVQIYRETIVLQHDILMYFA